jgi:hypothetical protein
MPTYYPTKDGINQNRCQPIDRGWADAIGRQRNNRSIGCIPFKLGWETFKGFKRSIQTANPVDESLRSFLQHNGLLHPAFTKSIKTLGID